MASKLARFEFSWLQCVGNIAREDVKNMHHWSGRTETATENGVDGAGSRRHCGSHSSVASSTVPDQWGMFCTPSCNILHTLLSTGFKSCDFGDHSWGGINSGVSLSNNAIVVRSRWAFQLSQGSVETLFRWGRKRLHHIAANLFRKLCATFHQNCPSFVGDITENILVSFSCGHSVHQLLITPALNLLLCLVVILAAHVCVIPGTVVWDHPVILRYTGSQKVSFRITCTDSIC